MKDIISKLVKELTFPLLARRSSLSGLYGHTKDLEKSQFLPKHKIEELQVERLKALLSHAYTTTTYYKRLFDDIEFVPEKLTTLDEIKRIPFLTKNIIRENCHPLLSSDFPSDQCHSSETGGTTGVKMKFWRNNSCLSPKEAARYRFEKWAGWDFGQRTGLVWTAQQDYVGHSSTKARIKNELYERQVVLPAVILDDDIINKYLRLLTQKKPTIIRAFSSPMFEVAQVALKQNLQFPSIKGIVSTGEPLYRHQRKLIEKAFRCKVFDSYRCREVGPIAQECEMQNGLHINSECLLVEVVEPEQGGYYEDGIGEIVVTDLLNFGMPFIRYKMGDMGKLSSRQCACGRGLPILDQISGRSADNLRTIDGKLITAGSLVLYLVDEAPGPLGQVQIIQDKTDHLLIRMTPEPSPTDQIKNYQRQTVKRLFGNNMNISFEIVDKISRGKSGKYQFAKYQV